MICVGYRQTPWGNGRRNNILTPYCVWRIGYSLQGPYQIAYRQTQNERYIVSILPLKLAISFFRIKQKRLVYVSGFLPLVSQIYVFFQCNALERILFLQKYIKRRDTGYRCKIFLFISFHPGEMIVPHGWRDRSTQVKRSYHMGETICFLSFNEFGWLKISL